MKSALSAFAAGIVFALGLGISGMAQPAKVVGFLDFTGNWDPSLAFVMLGAVATYAVSFRLIVRRPSPLLAPEFSLPTRTDIDGRLIVGAVLFGIGWGLAGFCPGPALVSLGAATNPALVFVPCMLAGMMAFQLWNRTRV